MKKLLIISALLIINYTIINFGQVEAEVITYPDSWGNAGFTLMQESSTEVEINFSIKEFTLDDVEINGETLQILNLPGVFLPNDAGAPDLPGSGRYIAIPQGASVEMIIVDSRSETFHDIDMAPAFSIPLETEEGPLEYNKNPDIYSTDAFYPDDPVILSETTQIRGVDVVILGITPFQYNPITKELIVYRDLHVVVSFNGGNGHFGEDRLRSRWWDPILRDMLLNYASLPEINYNYTSYNQEEFEYLIIIPNDPDFEAWANSIKTFRTLQGIRTGVVTTTDIGGNTTTAIEDYIDYAFDNWYPAPVAVLLLGDYGTTGSTIVSPIWYGGYNPCVSDNIYADVNGNQLPDIAFVRITAQDEDDLSTMIGKFLNYECTPPTNQNYYNNPIAVGQWQSNRWYILYSDIIYGFWENVLDKQPLREYAGYTNGQAPSDWSTNQNTSIIVNYFGPTGLGYIPATPSHLTDWGGNASRINNDINSGAFIIQHRGHGGKTSWCQPNYHISDLAGLYNDDLTFVLSINCLTGKFNWSNVCFAEAFHRHEKGALGVIAASEVSFSFVNDTYAWGMYDNMWPDFDPGYGGNDFDTDFILPCFANASGKYYLQVSSWPYNPDDKNTVYYLFHHHGDAFTTLYSEMPQDLTVIHDNVLICGVDFFNVTANEDALIALTVNGEIIGTGEGTGTPTSITIPPQIPGNTMKVTITKQNYYRYCEPVQIIPPSGPYVIYTDIQIDDSQGNVNGIFDPGETVDFIIKVKNIGNAIAYDVIGELTTDDTYITINTPSQNYGSINGGDEAEMAYNIFASESTPHWNITDFEFNINFDGQQTQYNFQFFIGFTDPLIDEGFDIFPPDGWYTEGVNNGNSWMGSNTNEAGGIAPEAYFFGEPIICGIQRLVTPLRSIAGLDIDCMRFSFKHSLCDSYGGSEFGVAISSNGINWTTLWKINTEPDYDTDGTIEIDIISSNIGSDNFQLCFYFSGTTNSGILWYIDDVLLEKIGMIEGTVTLNGGTGNVENVEINVDGQIIHPNSNGYYSIALQPGTYDVTASLLGGYRTQIIEDVVVINGVATNVDFCLEYGTYYVRQDGTGDYTEIQNAIDAAEDDFTIVVADGTYTGTNNKNLTWDGNIKHLVLKSENGAENCIIDCRVDSYSCDGRGFILDSGQDNRDVIRGFTVKNGYVQGLNGGGIYCENTSPTIAFNNIVSCSCWPYGQNHPGGGGIYITGGQPMITYNLISNCGIFNDQDPYANYHGGGIYCDSPVRIMYNTIDGCEAYTDHDPDPPTYYWGYDAGGGIFSSNPEAIIQGNTITNCWANSGGGIAGSGEIYDNVIEDCWSNHSGGGAIDGGNVIHNNIIRFNSSYSFDDDGGCGPSGGKGGGIYTTGDAIISNNTLEFNYSNDGGAAIHAEEVNDIQIINNTIQNNIFDLDVGLHETESTGISCYECSNILIANNSICNGSVLSGYDCAAIYIFNSSQYTDVIIRNNTIADNEGIGINGNGYYNSGGNFNISKCTITNNTFEGIISGSGDSEALISNCIIADNDVCGVDGNDNTEIMFSDIWNNGYDGQCNTWYCNVDESCVEEDPFFVNPANGDYSLTWDIDDRSPCIDTGDPDEQYNDPDETRSDMGAIPAIAHKYDNWQLPPYTVDDGWKWLSFPALDDLTNADDFDGDMAQYMLEDILDYTILDSVIWKPILEQGSGEIKIKWNGLEWTYLDHIFTSPQGYKFNMDDALQNYEYLEISGFLEDPNTVIHLWGNLEENWIGYFLEETQSIEDAFGSAMDNIYSITMQHWGNKREEQSPDAPWIIPESKVKQTVTYGDMLIVQCFDDMDFQWYNNGNVPPHEETKTSYFNFSEKADYVPIFVEFDPENIPDEIGVLVDGECKGASVVEDTLSHICAYILGGNGGELEFELYYDNKGTESNLNIKDYFVYNPETKLKEKRTIKVDENKEYYLVSFKADESETIPEHFSIQNFPNPFNPDILGTTIQYALPKETDVTITIYNIKGQLVKRIVKGMQSPGIYNVIWNGKDETGKSISNGIYFYQFSTDNKTLIKKMLLMR